MRKKLRMMMLAGVLSVGLLAGCGRNADIQPEEAVTQNQTENEIPGELEDNAAVEDSAENEDKSESATDGESEAEQPDGDAVTEELGNSEDSENTDEAEPEKDETAPEDSATVDVPDEKEDKPAKQPEESETPESKPEESKPEEKPEKQEKPEEPAHKHSYTESITTKAACEKTGVKTFTCDCGESYTESISAVEHQFDEGEYVQKPECDTEAVKEYTCTVCGATEKKKTGEYAEHDWETVEATGHYEEKVTGYEKKKVVICGCGFKAYDNVAWKEHEDACGTSGVAGYEQTPITENVWVEDTPAQTQCRNCGVTK